MRRTLAAALVLLAAAAAPTLPAQEVGDASPVSPASPGFDPLGALRGLGIDLVGDSDDEFLQPDVAFKLSAAPGDGDTAIARWEIADGYYLYRARMRFAAAQPEGASVGEPVLPAGKVKEDEYFGRMEVYYDAVEARLPLAGLGGAREAVLDVTYQGCADAGLCYPPITKSLVVSLDGAGGPGTGAPAFLDAVAPAAQLATLPEQDRLARALETGSPWLVLAAFVGLGLLLTFTPCVLPMVPILSSIIVGQGEDVSTRRAFTLSLTYVLAMASTYTAAGVLAGLSGANLQALFQDPWVLSAFAVVFVLLALSMFGLYELQVPVALQRRLAALSNQQRGGTYVGVAAMGLLSALIVGPCVAAPLAGALIYIARTGDAALGGAALFALSMGMGLPLLVIGTSAGRLMPRAGPWMVAVKAAFGVLLIGVAIYLLERVVTPPAALAMWAALLIVTAIYMGALDRLSESASGWRRLAKGAGLVVMVHGVLVMVGAASGGDDVLRPLTRLAGGAAERPALEFRTVKGTAGLDGALEAAAARGQPVMLDFYADWCVSCKELERDTFTDPTVQATLAGALLLRTDVTANDAEDQALLERLGLFGPPAILFFGPDGRERPQFRVVGFMGPEDFTRVAEQGLRAPPARLSMQRRTR